MSLSSPAREIFASAAARARARPALLLPPLLGVAAQISMQAALNGEAGPRVGAAAGAAATVLACAAFSELWLAEPAWDWARFGEGLLLFTFPVAALIVVGLASSAVFISLSRNSGLAAQNFLLATFAASKLVSGATTVFAALCLGAPRSLSVPGRWRAGLRAWALRAWLWLALVAASWAAQEALGFGLQALFHLLPASTPMPARRTLAVLGEAAASLLVLVACVAVPLEAARTDAS